MSKKHSDDQKFAIDQFGEDSFKHGIGAEAVQEILSKIEEAGVMPFDFDVTGASLETVFLSITQKK